MHVVGEIAAMAGVTVRTLHHYDEIGLLVPSARSAAGYRLYDDADVARLQRILVLRELELGLDEIRALLDDTTVDEDEVLARQLATLDDRIDRLQQVRKAVLRAMEAHEMGIDLTPEERLEVFGADVAEQLDDWEHEAEQEWGDTDAWTQSRARTSTYGADDWRAVTTEMDALHREMAAAMTAGEPPESVRAMDAAEAHRRLIHDRFYDCDHDMHANLAEMYVADERFTRTYEEIAVGLAAYVRDAILANGIRHA